MNKILPELFIDLDDTIYNLSEFVCKHYNLDYDDNFDYKTNTSYFWQDTKAPQSYFEEILNRRGIFLNGNPIGNAVEVINKLCTEGYKIYFVSLPQWNNSSTVEKVFWLKQYFPWVDFNTNIVFTGSKHLLDAENRIIYDDNPSHLVWNKGFNIVFDQPWNRDIKPFEGYRVSNHDDFYSVVHTITHMINNKIANDIDLHNLRNYYINKLHKGDV